MQKIFRTTSYTILILFSFSWSAYTLREDVLLLSVLLLFVTMIPHLLYKRVIISVIVIAIITAALSPYGITIRNLQGRPKFVECCPGIVVNFEKALKAQEDGKCILCSDVVSGFEPDFYWVW